MSNRIEHRGAQPLTLTRSFNVGNVFNRLGAFDCGRDQAAGCLERLPRENIAANAQCPHCANSQTKRDDRNLLRGIKHRLIARRNILHGAGRSRTRVTTRPPLRSMHAAFPHTAVPAGS